MTACSPEEINIPLEEFGFEPGFLEFSEKKYRYNDSTHSYYMYFLNEYFDSIEIWFASNNETSISSIELLDFFYPVEHGKSKFSQASEILKSFYGKNFEVDLIKEVEFTYQRRNKQIWKINGNIIELTGRDSLPDYVAFMSLKITFHPEADLQILE